MVLLSQRRRWINSTIHNLMELLFVHDLCGTFCFSMQFVIFMELVGTLALPAAISFTIYLIVLAIMGKPAIIPLILLALILGLPAVLIVMTSRKIVYVGWMLVYLLSLPIWNFVLPTYAYWHFDDFSWGDTRKVEGVKDKKGGHADRSGEFDSSVITMKKWSEYEMERRTAIARANNLPTPRFAERNSPGMEVFRNNIELARRYSDLSNESGNVPLTQMDYGVANHNSNQSYQVRTGEPSSSAPPPRKISKGHNGFEIDQIIKTDDNEPTIPASENHELGWIQQSAHDDNWANPAPHHVKHEDNEHSIEFDTAKKNDSDNTRIHKHNEDDNRSITSL